MRRTRAFLSYFEVRACHHLKEKMLLRAFLRDTRRKTVNNRFNQLLQYNSSGLSCWLSVIFLAIVLGSVGLGWVVNGFLLLLGLLILSPILAIGVLQWWLKRNLIQDNCPVCNYEFTGFKNTDFSCPSCSEPLQVVSGKFSRITPPGTIDINAVEVTVSSLEEEAD